MDIYDSKPNASFPLDSRECREQAAAANKKDEEEEEQLFTLVSHKFHFKNQRWRTENAFLIMTKMRVEWKLNIIAINLLIQFHH